MHLFLNTLVNYSSKALFSQTNGDFALSSVMLANFTENTHFGEEVTTHSYCLRHRVDRSYLKGTWKRSRVISIEHHLGCVTKTHHVAQ